MTKMPFYKYVQRSLCLLPSLFLVTLACLSVNTSTANALSCAQPTIDNAVIEESTIIFSGIIKSERKMTLKEKASIMWSSVKTKGGSISDLKVYEIEILNNWKGVPNTGTVDVAYNGYWGDNFSEGEKILFVSNEKAEDIIWIPLCGNTMDLDFAKKQNYIRILDEHIGIGNDFKIPALDRVCRSAAECTTVSTDCGGCSCGTPVAHKAAKKYMEMFEETCSKMTEDRMLCEMECEPHTPTCIEGLCE